MPGVMEFDQTKNILVNIFGDMGEYIQVIKT